MATTYHNDLQKLYVAYFNRPADAGGLAFYEDVLEKAAASGGTTAVTSMMAAISADFAKSTEYQTTYNQATNSAVVTAVYQNLFGRAPDATGLAFYVQALVDKKMTVDTMVTWIANGATGDDATIIASKVTVATAFTNALNTDAEKTAYNTKEAQAAAKEMLSDIKTTADATAAVANIDDHVADVVKAGTPFSLESGLASLGAAQADLADYLKAEKMTAAQIRGEVTKADNALAAEITVGTYTGASAGVKEALIADQVAYNDDALEAANDALEAAQAEVAKIDGLGDAIAAVTSAEEASDEAAEVAQEAQDDYTIAEGTFEVRSKGTTDGTPGTSNFRVLAENGTTVLANVKDGAIVVADKIDASKYPGLTELVAAANDWVGASADAVSASDAALVAQLQVESLENSTVKLSATFKSTDFVKTTVAAGTEPTIDQIADELAARVAANDGTAGAFRSLITGFNNSHDTDRADAVIAAEKGELGLAQAAVNNVDGLNEAVALIAAETKVGTTKAAVASTATVGNDGNVTLTATPTTKLATINPDTGKLVLESGVTAATYAGLADYIAAFNAEVDAQAKYDAFEIVDSSEDPISAQDFVADVANDKLLDDLAAAKLAAVAPSATDEAKYDAYIAAVGVEGAQAAVEDLDEAISDLEDAQAAAAELKSLEDEVKAAVADFTDNDFNAPVMLEGTANSFFGKTGSDIFVVAGEDKLAMSIGNFGRSGDDVLYIGEGFTLNKGDVDEDGVDTVMEVFFVQSGNNTIVTIETEAFGSNSAEAEIKITLTGVDAEDLTFSNGIISM